VSSESDIICGLAHRHSFDSQPESSIMVPVTSKFSVAMQYCCSGVRVSHCSDDWISTFRSARARVNIVQRKRRRIVNVKFPIFMTTVGKAKKNEEMRLSPLSTS